jgi:hypothetical protein
MNKTNKIHTKITNLNDLFWKFGFYIHVGAEPSKKEGKIKVLDLYIFPRYNTSFYLLVIESKKNDQSPAIEFK